MTPPPARETLAFSSALDAFEPWRDALARELPDIDVRRAEDVTDPAAVRYALVWNPPQGFFAAYPNLALVINLGAGVDALVVRDDLPDVPVTRISDPLMARMMASFVLFAVLRHARDIPVFERAQRQGRWAYQHPRTADAITVGVLGLGELGATAAREIARQGFDTRGWSRSLKTVEGVACVAGDAALPAFLSNVEILVVMLPLTPETSGLLDAERLALLPRGAKLINVSRGRVVDEAALVEALRSGRIAEATLDVFEIEPLPEASPLWAMDNVLITPHLASTALPGSATTQIAENVRRLRAGEAPLNVVDRRRGY